MQTQPDAHPEQPGDWKRNGYVWLVLAGPLLVIIAAFVTAYIAWHGADPGVAEKYQEMRNKADVGAMLPAQRARNHAATPADQIPMPRQPAQ